MNLFDDFSIKWKHKTPLNKPNVFFIVAVSGGVDSVVLCNLMHSLELNFAIAHCNFNLRGEESNRDEEFVQQLSLKLNVPFYNTSFNTLHEAEITKQSIQVTARNLRYSWFKQLQNSISISQNTTNVYLLTAHHANDNTETVLHHLIRGTGLNGMYGIAELDEKRKIFRPLLHFTKGQLIDFATENNINFVEDSSNIQDKYTRNYIRHKVIPTIEEKFPDWQQNMQFNIERFKDAAYFYNKTLAKELKKFISYKNNILQLPVNKLKKHAATQTLLWEILSPYGLQASQIQEVVKLLHAQNAASLTIQSVKIIRDRDWLLVVPIVEQLTTPILIEDFTKEVFFAHGKLCFSNLEHIEEDMLKKTSVNEVFIPAKLLTCPLVLRPTKVGDYFYPLGMTKKKKLSRFFIDAKVSAVEKEKVWVLEIDKKIVWVIGNRLDNRFRVQHLDQPLKKIVFSIT